MLNEVRDAIHANSIAKGFWEEPNTNITEKIMLVVTELSEAVEAMRKLDKEDLLFLTVRCNHVIKEFDVKGYDADMFTGGIKDTVGDEFADSIIRILDLCGRLGIDIEGHIKYKMEYNSTRPYLHGKQF